MTINALWFSCKVPVILVRFLITLEFYQQIFEKYSNAKFHENRSSGSRVVPCGRTDRQTDMTKLIVAFCYFANEHKGTQEKLYFHFTQTRSSFCALIFMSSACSRPKCCRPHHMKGYAGLIYLVVLEAGGEKLSWTFWLNLSMVHMLFDVTDAS